MLTAIGMAHYERFKSLETVAKAKLELAEAVAQRSGPVVFYEQVLELADCRAFQGRYRERTYVVGASTETKFRILESRQTAEGLLLTVRWQEKEYQLRAPLFGEHHTGNIALAFATACTLGIPAADAITALASVPQITHRLEVKTGVNGSRLIDDAYNSNPVGFASGLRLLDQLQTNGGRRILVTPGMVELGTAHDAEHARIGNLAGQFVDVLLAVVPQRIGSFVKSFREANPEGVVIFCAHLMEAQTWLNQNVGQEDVVLMENDLPDLYEKKLAL